MKLHIQEAFKTASKVKTKKTKTGHIMELLEVKNKEKVTGKFGDKEKRLIT